MVRLSAKIEPSPRDPLPHAIAIQEQDMPLRIQLGAGRLRNAPARIQRAFADPSWINLGDDPRTDGDRLLRGLKRIATGDWRGMAGAVISSVDRTVRRKDESAVPRIVPFVYHEGDRLDFPEASVDFVYSEHFLEHLFLNEALALMRECFRVLKPMGIMRTVVPDADLRTYAAAEPIGFPRRNMRFDHPDKHKTRWSVYSLVAALEVVGFDAMPLRFCGRTGTYTSTQPRVPGPSTSSAQTRRL